MKNTLVTAVLLGAVLFAGCSANSASGVATVVKKTNFSNISNDQNALNSLLVFDMTSSIPLLNSSNLAIAALPRMLNEASSAETQAGASSGTQDSAASSSVQDSSTVVAQDSISEMLSSIDLLLSNDLGFSVNQVTSTNANYTYQNDVTFSLLDGTKNNYSLFYNSVKEEKEIDEDQTETTVSIEGLSIIDEISYAFNLKSETEVSKTENESEVNFKLAKDEKNFVEVKNSLELEDGEKELEYEYRKVTDGIEETAYELSFENEDGKEEVEYAQANKEYDISSAVKDGLTLLTVEEKDLTTGAVTTSIYQRVIEEKDGQQTVTYVLYTK